MATVAHPAVADPLEQGLQRLAALLEDVVEDQPLVLLRHRGELDARPVHHRQAVPQLADVVVADLGHRPDGFLGVGQGELELDGSVLAPELELVEPLPEDSVEVQTGRGHVDRHGAMEAVAHVFVEQQAEGDTISFATFGFVARQHVQHVGNCSELEYRGKKMPHFSAIPLAGCRRVDQGPGVKRVRPFPFYRLPRIARNQVDVGRNFRAHLPLATGPAFGEMERGLGGPLRFHLVECFVAHARDLESLLAGVVVRLAGTGERWGLIVIDRVLAVALAGRALGIDQAGVSELPAPRQPTLAETGAIELLVQLLAEDQPFRVTGVVEPDALLGLMGTLADDALVHVLEARVESPVGVGPARLIVPDAIAAAAAPVRARGALLRRRERLAAQSFMSRLELARVRLVGARLGEMRVGDVLAFDVRAPRPNAPVEGWLCVGRGAFTVEIRSDVVHITHPFRLYEGEFMSQEPASRNADPSATDQLLRELNVEIVCELGRVSMSGRELVELEPGAVIPIPRPLAGPIDLTVGGRLVGRGELVDVEGDLGVRLTELVG